MENKEKNIKIATRLAEEILIPIHAKMEVLPNPQKISGWVGSMGENTEWQANSWKIKILNSDFGGEAITISDHLLTNIVLLAQNISSRTYEKLLGENKSRDMITYIYTNSKLWSEKLNNLTI